MSKKVHVKLTREVLENLSRDRLKNVRRIAKTNVSYADPVCGCCQEHIERQSGRVDEELLAEEKAYATMVCEIWDRKYGE